MKPREVVEIEQRLDRLFRKVRDFSDDAEMQSHWSRYLCILASGYLETAVSAICREYARQRAQREVVNFVERSLSDFQNPNMEKIAQLIGSFSKEWEVSVRDYAAGEVKDAVDSIVSNRHNIAHGKNVGITFATINAYYRNAKRLVAFLSQPL